MQFKKTDMRKAEQYFTPKPKSKKKEYKFTASINGVNVDFYTASGIFSPRQIDMGSLALIRFMELNKKSRILDLGCGYGAVGIYAAIFCPSTDVVLADVNHRVVECAKKNIYSNNIKNAIAKQSHMFSSMKEDMFDTILLNPPQSAGLEICYEMIEKSFEHLNSGGSLQVVVRRRKGGERISDKMEEVFGNVSVLGKKAGYWVYKSEKNN